MASIALQKWLTSRTVELDEFETAHKAVGKAGRGLINQSYVMMLSSHFQGFCRDLHTESVQHLVRKLTHPDFEYIASVNLTTARRLDQGNPGFDNIRLDFDRLGLDLQTELIGHSAQSERGKEVLKEIIAWRNAIAHQDFDSNKLGGRITPRLQQIRTWRRVCDQLARTMDTVMKDHLQSLIGAEPW